MIIIIIIAVCAFALIFFKEYDQLQKEQRKYQKVIWIIRLKMSINSN